MGSGCSLSPNGGGRNALLTPHALSVPRRLDVRGWEGGDMTVADVHLLPEHPVRSAAGARGGPAQAEVGPVRM